MLEPENVVKSDSVWIIGLSWMQDDESNDDIRGNMSWQPRNVEHEDRSSGDSLQTHIH